MYTLTIVSRVASDRVVQYFYKWVCNMTTEISQDLSGRQAPVRRQKLNATRRRRETKDFPQNLIFVFFRTTIDLTRKSIIPNSIVCGVLIVLELLCIYSARIWGKGSQRVSSIKVFLFF